MAVSLLPTLRLYRQPFWLAPLLPLAAALYSAMTFASAWRRWRGQGGRWKGRVQDTHARSGPPPGPPMIEAPAMIEPDVWLNRTVDVYGTDGAGSLAFGCPCIL